MMYGADAEELDRIAALAGSKAARMEAIRRDLGRRVHSSPWEGRSAERFRRQWETDFNRVMVEAVGFLHSAERELRLNAAQQLQASGAAGGSVGSFLVGGEVPGRLPGWLSTASPEDRKLLADLFGGLSRVAGGAGNALGLGLLKAGDITGADIAGAGLGGMSLAMAVFGLLAPEGSNWKLAAEGMDHLFDMGSAAVVAANTLAKSPVSKWVPGLGLVGGGLGLIGDYHDIMAGKGSTASNGLSMVGNATTMVGSALMLSGVGAPVGAALMAVGTVASTASWAIENKDAIAKFGRDTVDQVNDLGMKAAHAVAGGVDAVKDGVESIGSDLAASVQHSLGFMRGFL